MNFLRDQLLFFTLFFRFFRLKSCVFKNLSQNSQLLKTLSIVKYPLNSLKLIPPTEPNNFKELTKKTLNMNREETLNLVEDTNCRHLLAELFRTLDLTPNKIRCLENKVEVLENQVAEQEEYSSKDSIIIENMPIHRSNEPSSHQV